jgi:hypothetical protein
MASELSDSNAIFYYINSMEKKRKYNLTGKVIGGGKYMIISEKQRTPENEVVAKILERCEQLNYSFLGFKDNQYSNIHTRIILKCNEHNVQWDTMTIKHFLYRKQNGCPICRKEAQHNRQVNKTPIENIEKQCVIRNYTFLGFVGREYKNEKTKLILKCNICGNIWESCSYRNFVHNNRGCPQCNRSKLENNVKKILTDNNINFIQNYKGFDWLKNVRNLELDFYLPEYNVGIECQGIQHFKPVERFGGEDGLIYIQANDKIKKQLCEDHSIRLYYINYNDNIDTIIAQILGLT